ncbi:MAG: class I SAM-dependent methyltransferase [Candidatus Azambacteria bacterium]|nr:class I SAM-dependent methyltransferase [Candidatus Azambacteria bacterium]
MDKLTQEKLLELVRRSYDQIAENFDITRQKYLWPEFLKLASEVKDGDSMLDVGCGNGRLVQALVGKNIKYLGVDESQRLIEIARLKFQNPNNKSQTNSKSQIPIFKQIPNAKFIVGDILQLDKVVKEEFDWVFCIAVLHHIPGEDLRLKALEQLGEKLKPKGKIILTVWNLWPQVKFRKLIIKYGLQKLIGINKMQFGDLLFDWKNSRGEKIGRRYYHAFRNGELEKIVQKANLNIDKLYKDKYNYYLILNK